MFLWVIILKLCLVEEAGVLNLCQITELRKQLKVESLHDLKEYRP